MENNTSFVDKYKDLVTRNVCVTHGVDYDDKVARANLAYRLLTGNDSLLIVPLHKDVDFVINSHGEFTNTDMTKMYGRTTDLVIEPLMIACDIIADNPVSESTSTEKVLTEKICATEGNLMWIAKLFLLAHTFYKIQGDDKTPDLWKLCDHSYDCNHIEPKQKLSFMSMTYFGFMTGSCDGPKGDNWDYNVRACDAFLNTNYYESGDGVFSSKDLLEAYISEHNMNIHFASPKK